MRHRPIPELAPDEWLDGAEAAVAAAVGGAADRSSTSDELADAVTDERTRYHLAASRADVLRSLDIAPGATVLEVGAGCGAVTRYLGEAAARVDAWEPTPARAAVAAARVADLDTVAVHVGGLDDIAPDVRADVVVAVGVVEHLAAHRPLGDVVAALAHHVADGGHLVIAVENRLGVKYLCGAPEDHEGVPWLGVEGYRHARPRARTPSRAALTDALAAAGLVPLVLGALPDYKHARLVLHPDLLAHPDAGAVATAAGLFPSDDVGGTRAPAADERAVWRQFVAAGLGADVVNSFVAVGRRGGPVTLWPEHRLAVAHTSDRRTPFATRTTVGRGAGGGATLDRGRLAGDDAPVELGGLRHVATVAGWRDGTDLLDVVAVAPDRRRQLLAAWAALVDGAVDADGRRALDAVPRNVVVAGNGTCALIDQEWWAADVTAAEVIGRGLLGAAIALADALAPDPAGPATAAALAAELAAELAVSRGPLAADWLDVAVDSEAALRARIELRDQAGTALAQGRHAVTLRAALCRPVGGLRADGARVPSAPAAAARIGELEAMVAAQQDDLRRNVEHAAQADAAFARTLQELLDAQAAVRALHGEVARRDVDLVRLAAARDEVAAAAGRAARQHADGAAALGDELDHVRRSAVAAAEAVARQAAIARALAADLAAERADADADAAAEAALYDHLAALHRTKVLRWTAPARRWWAAVLRTLGADVEGPTTVPARRPITRRRGEPPFGAGADDDSGRHDDQR